MKNQYICQRCFFCLLINYWIFSFLVTFLIQKIIVGIITTILTTTVFQARLRQSYTWAFVHGLRTGSHTAFLWETYFESSFSTNSSYTESMFSTLSQGLLTSAFTLFHSSPSQSDGCRREHLSYPLFEERTGFSCLFSTQSSTFEAHSGCSDQTSFNTAFWSYDEYGSSSGSPSSLLLRLLFEVATTNHYPACSCTTGQVVISS